MRLLLFISMSLFAAGSFAESDLEMKVRVLEKQLANKKAALVCANSIHGGGVDHLATEINSIIQGLAGAVTLSPPALSLNGSNHTLCVTVSTDR